MNAIEIKHLTKGFKTKQALTGLDMTVPLGAIYGFIGENGSGKSTTEKILCGLLVPDGGAIKLFGQDYTAVDIRAKVGVLIEAPGCYENYSVWNNMMLQAANLSIKQPKEEIARVLKLVRMEGAASNKYKNCSLGMKQRIGIAMALLGNPSLLILDEPVNGLDADGMRLMRQILVDISKEHCTILISSHLLGELEKIATHYGIVREGTMLCEMTAEELEADCPTYVAVQAKEMAIAHALLQRKYLKVKVENQSIRVYDAVDAEEVVTYLYEQGVLVSEVKTDKISLEEYYINLTNEQGGRKK